MSATAGNDGGARIAVVVKGYPRLSETFIAQEILGLERRGISLLLGFPIERWRILLGKNLGALVLRAPGLLVLLVAGMFLAPLPLLPAAATITVVTLLLSAGVDNFPSILFPTTMPPPGRNPYAGAAAGTRGLGGALLGLLLMAAALLVSSPFVFLAWLPLLLERPWLWAVSLPLSEGSDGELAR